jgi:hypothetical protein
LIVSIKGFRHKEGYEPSEAKWPWRQQKQRVDWKLSFYIPFSYKGNKPTLTPYSITDSLEPQRILFKIIWSIKNMLNYLNVKKFKTFTFPRLIAAALGFIVNLFPTYAAETSEEPAHTKTLNTSGLGKRLREETKPLDLPKKFKGKEKIEKKTRRERILN